MRETVRREPGACGLARARWRLDDLRAAVPALAGHSRSGVSRLLRRLRVRLKRGRLRLHSPDPAYGAKKAAVGRALALARAHPARVSVVYGDEASCYRQPTLADRWYPVGQEPTAGLSHRANTRHRVCGSLDAVTGRVTRVEGSKTGVPELKRFLRDLRDAYPGRSLFLVGDNWPVRAHPEVRAEAARRRIRILWLPTYAPWLNPIEKLWRWLKQDLLHHHAAADRWDELKAGIGRFLDRFVHGSPALLRYVGLSPD